MSSGSLSVNVIPQQENPVAAAIQQMLAQWQAKRAQETEAKAVESRFGRTLAETQRVNDATIGQTTAQTEKTRADMEAARADEVIKGVFLRVAPLIEQKEFGKAEEFMRTVAPNLEKIPGVKERLQSWFTNLPDTPGSAMVRNANQTVADATGRAATGGQSPVDINMASQFATGGAQMTAPAFANQTQREQGPEAVSRAAAIESGRAPSASQSLAASTQQQIAAANDATQVKIAAMNNETRANVADAKSKANVAGVTPEQQQLKDEAARLVDELIHHPGRENATGVSGTMMNRVPASDARGYASKIERLKSLLSLDNLKLLKGAMSDKDLLFLQSIPAALDLGMSDSEHLSELQRLSSSLHGGASGNGTTIKYDASGDRVQ